eukprot:TRINITY_DN20860_c0_g1_i2.p1 TRINITY_DN20860_c0_g1~~TRINITY_DN20860_c0_g1_i2.p1  ORF type:complete len:107 (-),score=13.58 TRINITY_DN20860_c0_g1_i2:352-672(-)
MTNAVPDLTVSITGSLSSDELFSLRLPCTTSIREVKQRIQQLHGVNPFCQHITLASNRPTSSGAAIDDRHILEDLPQPIELSLTKLCYPEPPDKAKSLSAGVSKAR